MAAEERNRLIREGNKILKALSMGNTREESEKRIAAAAVELQKLAEAIVEDFDEQRENFGDAEGLLDHWEETTGFKEEGWGTAADELDSWDSMRSTPHNRDESDAEWWEAEFEELSAVWETAETQY